MKREKGFYWVRAQDEWIVAFFDGDYWDSHVQYTECDDDGWDEIDETPIKNPDAQ